MTPSESSFFFVRPLIEDEKEKEHEDESHNF